MKLNKRFFSKSDFRILLSSLVNFVIKIVIVYYAIDVLKLNPEKSYYLILTLILVISFFSNLKIGFGKKFKLKFLTKWLFVMINLLILENYLFLSFQDLFEVKAILSFILSLGLYTIRFLLQKLFVFN